MKVLSWLTGFFFLVGFGTTAVLFVWYDPLVEPWRRTSEGVAPPPLTPQAWLTIAGATVALGLITLVLAVVRRRRSRRGKKGSAPPASDSRPMAPHIHAALGEDLLAQFEVNWKTFAAYTQDLLHRKLKELEAAPARSAQDIQEQVELLTHALLDLRRDLTTTASQVKEISHSVVSRLLAASVEGSREGPAGRSARSAGQEQVQPKGQGLSQERPSSKEDALSKRAAPADRADSAETEKGPHAPAGAPAEGSGYEAAKEELYPGGEIVLRKVESDVEHADTLFKQLKAVLSTPGLRPVGGGDQEVQNARSADENDLHELEKAWGEHLESLKGEVRDARRRNDYLVKKLTEARENEEKLQLDLAEAAAREQALQRDLDEGRSKRGLEFEEQGAALHRERDTLLKLQLAEKGKKDAERRLAVLEEAKKSLEAALSSQKAHAEAGLREVESLRKETLRLQGELQTAKGEKRQLEDRVTSLDEQGKATQEELRSMSEEIERLCTERDAEEEARLRQADDELSHLLAALEEAQGTTEGLRAEKALWEKERSRLEARLAELEGGLASGHAESAAQLAQAENSLAGVRAQLSVVEGKLVETEGRLARAESRIVETDRKRSLAEGRSLDLGRRLAEAEERVATTEAALREAERRVQEGEGRAAALEAQVRSHACQNMVVPAERGPQEESKLREIEEQVGKLMTALDASQAAQAEAKADAEKAHAQAEKSRTEAERALAARDEAHRELDRAGAARAECEKECACLRVELAAAQAVCREAQSREATWNAQVAGLRSELEAAQAALKEVELARAKALDEVHRMHSEVEGATASFHELQAAKASAEEQVANLRNDLDAARASLEGLEGARIASTEESARIRAELEAAHVALETAQDDNRRLEEALRSSAAESERLEKGLHDESQLCAALREECESLKAHRAEAETARISEQGVAQAKLAEADARLADLARKLEEGAARTSEAEGRLGTVHEQLSEWKRRCTTSEERMAELQAQYAEMAKKLIEAEHQLKAAGGTDGTTGDSREGASGWRAAGDKSLPQLRRLEDENRALIASVERLGRELESLRAEADGIRRFQSALVDGGIPMAIVATDAAMKVFAWSPAAERLWERDAASALGRALSDRESTGVDGQVVECARLALRQGCHVPIQQISVGVKGGKPKHLRGSCDPILGPRGEVLGIVLGLQDITREVENAINAKCQTLYSQSLTRSLPVALIVMDAHDRVISWNRAAETLFDIKEQSAIGHVFFTLETPLAKAAFREHLERSRKDHVPHRIRVRMEVRGNADYYIVTESPFLGSDGAPCGTILMVQSVLQPAHAEK